MDIPTVDSCTVAACATLLGLAAVSLIWLIYMSVAAWRMQRALKMLEAGLRAAHQDVWRLRQQLRDLSRR